jgi:hypothetical protein
VGAVTSGIMAILGPFANEENNSMTEAEWIKMWLADEDFDFLFNFLDGKVKPSERKLRLFACNCSRCIWRLITDESTRRAVETAEQFADGQITESWLAAVHNNAEGAFREAWDHRPTAEVDGGLQLTDRDATVACDILGLAELVLRPYFDPIVSRDAVDSVAGIVSRSAIFQEQWGTEAGDSAAEEALQSDWPRLLQLFRCMFGNPFRPVTIDRSCLGWNGATIPKLAQVIYENYRFTDLPILADALEESGCANGEILGHCRQQVEHGRGCWVVDLMLGKS